MENNLISKLELIIDKLFNSKKNNNSECIFNDEEKEFIYNIRIDLEPIDNFQKKLNEFVYLVCNVKNNLDKEYIASLKTFLSVINLYFEDENIEDKEYLGFKIKTLKEKLKWRNKILTLSQFTALEMLKNYNVFLKAGTGAGKTFLTSYFLVERYLEHKKNNKNSEEKFVFIVPTELLEDQIIWNLKNEFKGEIEEDEIGKAIDENNVLIITAEKLISHINPKNVDITINTLIIDEAHLLLEENDSRSEFMQHLLFHYFNKKPTINKIIFVSPFVLNKDLIFEKINLKDEYNNKFVSIVIKTQTRKNKFILNDEILTTDNGEQFNNTIINNPESVICIYGNSKDNVKKIASEWFENKEYLKNIKKCRESELHPELISEIEKELNSNEFRKYENYLNFEYLKEGICYLTSAIPEQIKLKIIDLVNKRYIRLVVATYLIIAGVDLPFDITLIENRKINNKVMSNNDIINFFGRAGRINQSKKSYGAGFALIKLSENNKDKKWWNENKEEIFSKLNSDTNNYPSSIDSKNSNFVSLSYEKYNENKEIKYILEPRVNPSKTDQISKIANNENYHFLIKKFFDREKNIKSRDNYDILIFLCLYDFWDYEIGVKKINIEFEKFNEWFINNNFNTTIFSNEKKPFKLGNINSDLNYYIKYNFDIETAFKVFIKKENERNFSDSTIPTLNIERFILNNKNIGKYLFIMFLNHFWSLIEKPIYTNISVYLTYHIINFDFYQFIKKYNYSKFVLEILKEHNVLQIWKNINSFDNDINEILNWFKKIEEKFTTNQQNSNLSNMFYKSLWNCLKKEPNFITDLEEFIKNKNL